MALNSMYENLMGLPLFNGVSYNRISEIVGGTRLAFLKFLPGEKIVMAGDPCTGLMFVIGGKVRLSIRNSSDRFIVSRTLEAPSVISPDFLFGRNTLFPASVTAIDTVSIMEIEKTTSFPLSAAMKSASSTILTSFQPTPEKAIDGVVALTSGSLEERIALRIIALTQRDAKDIVLACRQRDLYSLFGVQRSSFINTLDSMKERGLIDYGPTEIRVISRNDLRSILLKSPD